MLYAATRRVDTDWTARLCEVDENGRSINLQEGIVRARFRDSLTEPSLIEPDRVYTTGSSWVRSGCGFPPATAFG